MRNDALDELDNVPSLTTSARDRDDFERDVEPEPVRYGNQRPAKPARSGTGPLWALVLALVIALGGLGWWSYQQISLMEQQLVATQESFARISEEAAGRIQDISGKVVATESNVTSGSEALKLQVKQLQTRLAEIAKQQQTLVTQQSGQDQRVDQVSKDLVALQGAADSRLKGIAGDVETLKGSQGDLGKLTSQVKGVSSQVEQLEPQLKSLSADVQTLKKQNPSQAIDGLQQDLLVLRSEMDNRPAAPAQSTTDTAEFDAFRAQMTRNISTLQSQVQNLQQQINAR
jgi:chromosome segregation ATPase